jgi:Tol biopolymer transport system component
LPPRLQAKSYLSPILNNPFSKSVAPFNPFPKSVAPFNPFPKSVASPSPRLFCLLLTISILLQSCNLPQPSPTSQIQEIPSQTPIASQPPPEPETITPRHTESPSAESPQLPGLRLVYVKDGDLWMWAQAGIRQLTTSGRAFWPKISPDGEIIVYLRQLDDFHAELWAVNSDGSNDRRLVSVADLDQIGGGVRDPSAVAINPYHYEWVPGSHTVAFNTQQVFQGPGLSLLDDLNLVKADTGELTFLLLSGWGGEFVYSPDGKHVALINPSTILLMDADGSNYRPVFSYEAVITYSEYRYYASPVWSPGGDLLRLVLPPPDPLATPLQPTALWVIPSDGSQPFQVGQVQAVPFFEMPVTFSPDRSRLIYLQEVGQPAENQRQLLIANPDGSGEWVYQKSALLAFQVWSVDSQHFAFSSGEDHAMWLGSQDAAALPFSADPYGISSLRWVDASHTVYVQEKNGAFELILASQDGGSLTIDVVPAPPPSYDFAFSPD